jgi:hypothetical protein
MKRFKNIHLFLSGFTPAAVLILSACASSPAINFANQNNPGGGNPNNSCNAGGLSANGETCNNGGGGEVGNGLITYTQPDPTVTPVKADILFVVDTSGSLTEPGQELDSVASGLSNMIGAFPVNSDFRIAVMLAHEATQWSGSLYSYAGSGPTVLSYPGSSLAQVQSNLRTRMLNVVSDGGADGGEFGIGSLTRGLTPNKFAESRAAGFFRPDATLTVVFVSDENDICYQADPSHNFLVSVGEANTYENVCYNGPGNLIYSADGLYQRLLAIQGSRPLAIAGVVFNGVNGPVYTGGSGNENGLGLGYLDLISMSHGVSVDLTDPAPDPNPNQPDPARIAQGMAYIGNFSVNSSYQPRTDFLLPEAHVIAETIVVKVDGHVIPHTFLESSNVVQILLADAGASGAVVTISYQYDIP